MDGQNDGIAIPMPRYLHSFACERTIKMLIN